MKSNKAPGRARLLFSESDARSRGHNNISWRYLLSLPQLNTISESVILASLHKQKDSLIMITADASERLISEVIHPK